MRSEGAVAILRSGGLSPTCRLLHLHRRNVFALDWRLFPPYEYKGFFEVTRGRLPCGYYTATKQSLTLPITYTILQAKKAVFTGADHLLEKNTEKMIFCNVTPAKPRIRKAFSSEFASSSIVHFDRVGTCMLGGQYQINLRLIHQSIQVQPFDCSDPKSKWIGLIDYGWIA